MATNASSMGFNLGIGYGPGAQGMVGVGNDYFGIYGIVGLKKSPYPEIDGSYYGGVLLQLNPVSLKITDNVKLYPTVLGEYYSGVEPVDNLGNRGGYENFCLGGGGGVRWGDFNFVAGALRPFGASIEKILPVGMLTYVLHFR